MDVLNRSIGTRIKSDVKLLAVAAYQFQMEQMPELKGFNTPEFVEKSIQDTEYTILYLSSAISVSSPKLLENYVKWFISLMESISLPVKRSFIKTFS